MKIRNYIKKDIPQILNCFVELQDAEHKIEKNRVTGLEFAKQYFSRLQKGLKKMDGDIFVAAEDNVIFGLIGVFIDPNNFIELPGKHAYISDIVVLKKYQRQGIAKKLMKFAEVFAKSKNLKEIRVMALAKNNPVIQLNKSLKYKEQEITLIKRFK